MYARVSLSKVVASGTDTSLCVQHAKSVMYHSAQLGKHIPTRLESVIDTPPSLLMTPGRGEKDQGTARTCREIFTSFEHLRVSQKFVRPIIIGRIRGGTAQKCRNGR